jgi:hypothetical protein
MIIPLKVAMTSVTSKLIRPQNLRSTGGPSFLLVKAWAIPAGLSSDRVITIETENSNSSIDSAAPGRGIFASFSPFGLDIHPQEAPFQTLNFGGVMTLRGDNIYLLIISLTLFFVTRRNCFLTILRLP